MNTRGQSLREQKDLDKLNYLRTQVRNGLRGERKELFLAGVVKTEE